ncbi:Ldh family oxidoreductase [Paracoccus yeei]|uniref:Ldh family oxidoreductase n=1 Tax=Paracoccus yeei TaxID=147645 RepID=UPI003BF89242
MAAILVQNCAACKRDGTFSHGVLRIPGYLATLHSGWADDHARPQISRVGESYLRINAMNGFAQPALETAREDIHAMIGESGAAIVGYGICTISARSGRRERARLC